MRMFGLSSMTRTSRLSMYCSSSVIFLSLSDSCFSCLSTREMSSARVSWEYGPFGLPSFACKRIGRGPLIWCADIKSIHMEKQTHSLVPWKPRVKPINKSYLCDFSEDFWGFFINFHLNHRVGRLSHRAEGFYGQKPAGANNRRRVNSNDVPVCE